MQNINIYHIFLQSNILIKLVIIILLISSIVSWTIIIHRTFVIKLYTIKSKKFLKKFWSRVGLLKIYREDILPNKNRLTSIERIFFSGFREFLRLKNTNYSSTNTIIDGTLISMKITIDTELDYLENGIPFLGTIGSISPYIGLFGTICGMINSFTNLGIIKNTNLQILGISIAETLISTAMGLFASIPAIIAFNHFNICINKIENEFNNFKKKFIAILYIEIYTNNNKIQINNLHEKTNKIRN